MCEHCSTYKPLLGGSTTYQPKKRPTTSDTLRSISAGASDSCCSWRQGCCGGGCCNQISCCSTEPEPENRPSEKAPPVGYGYGSGSGSGYGYGYGYSQSGMTSYPLEMTGFATQEKVPCVNIAKKIPMCFGGECKDTEECENRESDSAPRQSDR
ncbi:uncharacterized protein LOC128875520 [Hylaeus volcanicus]|uniref:uncharacterized protein LOC128875520 n=1 Tax=Hylaeus volcanicus TaxID=313075 RepID=UPI0023B7990D|nr:uncharacterized protein LOC128875520 [Hylaeus volcanicus]